MSAYQVSTDLIDLIVSACFGREFGADIEPQRIYYRGEAAIYTPEMRDLVSRYDGTADMWCIDLSGATYLGPRDRGFRLYRADILGRELIAANCASLAARYSYDTKADQIGGMVGYLPDSYTFRRVERSRFADLGHVFGALASFEYQSCETCTRTLAEVITARIRLNVAYKVTAECAPDGGAWSWSRDYAQRQTVLERIKL